jgi:hypothetical protein
MCAYKINGFVIYYRNAYEYMYITCLMCDLITNMADSCGSMPNYANLMAIHVLTFCTMKTICSSS